VQHVDIVLRFTSTVDGCCRKQQRRDQCCVLCEHEQKQVTFLELFFVVSILLFDVILEDAAERRTAAVQCTMYVHCTKSKCDSFPIQDQFTILIIIRLAMK